MLDPMSYQTHLDMVAERHNKQPRLVSNDSGSLISAFDAITGIRHRPGSVPLPLPDTDLSKEMHHTARVRDRFFKFHQRTLVPRILEQRTWQQNSQEQCEVGDVVWDKSRFSEKHLHYGISEVVGVRGSAGENRVCRLRSIHLQGKSRTNHFSKTRLFTESAVHPGPVHGPPRTGRGG